MSQMKDQDKVKVKVKSLSLTLWDPMDCSLPGSSIHGIFQARILKWFAITLSSGPCFVRILNRDPSIVVGPTWHGS